MSIPSQNNAVPIPTGTTNLENTATAVADSLSPTDTVNTAIQETASSPLDQFIAITDAGGPVIVILMLMSIVALTIFITKSLQFQKISSRKSKAIDLALTAWFDKKPSLAVEKLQKTSHPASSVIATAIKLTASKADETIAREEVARLAQRELVKARSHLKVLEVIATLSPLLGLLGTVVGMIEAFKQLQGAGATVDPSILSGGIWEALLTTAAGLVVAIPTVVALNWLEQKIEHLKFLFEDTLTQIFTRKIT